MFVLNALPIGSVHLVKTEIFKSGKRHRTSGVLGKSGTDGTISDVPVISIVWFVMIGDSQSRGDFSSVGRLAPVRGKVKIPAYESDTWGTRHAEL